MFAPVRNTGLTGFTLISDDISSKSVIVADIRRFFLSQIIRIVPPL